MKDPQNRAENIDGELNPNIEAAASSLSQQIEDSSSSNDAKNVTNMKSDPVEMNQKSPTIPTGGHHILPAETHSDIILNSDKEKTSSDHDRISEINDLKKGYDNTNNDDIGGIVPKGSTAISFADIQLEIGNMKETEKANILDLTGKIKCDNELLNLLTKRLGDQEELSKELESHLETQKKKINDMQQVLNVMNITQQTDVNNSTVYALRDTATSVLTLEPALAPALTVPITELQATDLKTETETISLKSSGTGIVPSEIGRASCRERV